ncbi:hypothetical protein CLHOM_08620 [Clostridium homopropionicum DSM 5847]|uniref:Uncharacterized protein n=1 Tax=Clostridium homopropionicum DSM 5847 TaxID=1121318 RepID=A0A0L6ZCM9_9CLOT|nr:hypothetical protein [Clostridium homopropionicum]KOA20720.1 hypothetical protein CLHOM_08620 [Clostridium homopropionicum DSM 5847]SFF90735.1 hypothetical protein SAMN04488501_103139 [Clostridium homopropionicum]
MNKEFVKNMIKAEKYKYRAIKEILPSDLRKRVDDLERETLNLIKDVVFEIMKENLEEKTSKNTTPKTTKKVDIDFS